MSEKSSEIKVASTITVDLKSHTVELTKIEAEFLYSQLGNVLGKHEFTQSIYPWTGPFFKGVGGGPNTSFR